MRKITIETFIDEVLSEWKKRDPLHPKSLNPEEVSRSVVSGIVGDKSWLNLSCEECGKKVEEVVLFECPYNDWDKHFAVCSSCLKKSVDILYKENEQ